MHDEPSKLAALMREARVPPSRLTPDDVLRRGRHSVILRRSLVVGAAAAGVMAVAGVVNLRLGDDDSAPVVVPPSSLPPPSPSPARPGWTPTRLAKPPGTAVYLPAQAVDFSGRFVVGGSGPVIVLWDNGIPALLPEPEPNLVDNFPRAVNAKGHVVGNATREDGREFAWVYRDGRITKLPGPQGERRYQAADINERGDVVGGSIGSGGLLWRAADPGRVSRLTGIDGASAIGDDGTIGSTVNDGDNPCVLLPPDGKRRILPGAPGDPRGKVFALRGEWAAGWVANRSNSSNLMAARWNLRTGELTSYPELTRPALAVSAAGAILAGRGEVMSEQPVVVDPEGTRYPLAGTAPRPTDGPARFDWQLHATAMSGDGTVVVGYEADQAGSHPLVWRFG